MKSFEKQYNLRMSDFDQHNNIRPSSIFDLFQEGASRHAEYLGCGLMAMTERNLGWVLVNVRYKILKKFSLNQDVILKTWPLKNTGAKFQREFLIKDLDGEVVLQGQSIWTVIDLNTRKIVPLKSFYNITDFLPDTAIDGRFCKITVPDGEFIFAGQKTVYKHEIDTNGHMNNVKYANILFDYIPYLDNYDIEFLQIDYHKELKTNDVISVYYLAVEDKIYCKGVKGDELIFTIEAIFNQNYVFHNIV